MVCLACRDLLPRLEYNHAGCTPSIIPQYFICPRVRFALSIEVSLKKIMHGHLNNVICNFCCVHVITILLTSTCIGEVLDIYEVIEKTGGSLTKP